MFSRVLVQLLLISGGKKLRYFSTQCPRRDVAVVTTRGYFLGDSMKWDFLVVLNLNKYNLEKIFCMVFPLNWKFFASAGWWCKEVEAKFSHLGFLLRL